jgi:hypothetical protein
MTLKSATPIQGMPPNETPVAVLPKDESFEAYRISVIETVRRIFQNTDPVKSLPLDAFLENLDHGARHSHNVYVKAMEIVRYLSDEEQNGVDLELIYLMATVHDSGRFHISENSKKQAKCERRHDLCGAAQVRLGNRKILRRGEPSMSSERIEKLDDYVRNHDFFNTRLDGDSYREPLSLEGQIVRLADRMSTDITEEVRRYWETGKRLKTPYFIKGIPFEDRAHFSFRKVKDYIKAGKFDEFTFFLALLSMSKDDFAHSVLAGTYDEWAKTKHRAVEEILIIAREEGFSHEDIAEMTDLITAYAKHFHIDLAI